MCHRQQRRGGKYLHLSTENTQLCIFAGKKNRVRCSMHCGCVCTDSCIPAHFPITYTHKCLSLFSRSAGLLSKCGDSGRLPQSEGAEDPQQFPGVQPGAGRHGHLHERHRGRLLQLPEVSAAVPALFRNERCWDCFSAAACVEQTKGSAGRWASVNNQHAVVTYNR